MDEDSDEVINNVNNKNKANSPYEIYLSVNRVRVEFQIDTGAGVSAISSQLHQMKMKNIPLQPTTGKLSVYSGEAFEVVGAIKGDIEYQDTTTAGNIYVVKNGGPPILGRNLLNKLGFTNEFINKLQKPNNAYKHKIGTYS